MNISYHDVTYWLRANLKTLLLVELACLLIAGIYFLVAPRIYEANFSIGLPKVQATPSTNPNLPKLRLLISPQEFIRPTQDPMAYSEEFVAQCMGGDSNTNRKKMINALQLGVKQQGNEIAFTIRLEGSERTATCAKSFLTKVLSDLTLTQDNYLKAANTANSSAGNSQNAMDFALPVLIQPIRMSDSYIKPDLSKLLVTAVSAGVFLTIFFAALRKKYRA